MKNRVDPALREQAARFALRFACDDCVHFDTSGERCSLEYPAAPRRDALRREHIEFCKDFDLG